MPTAGYLGKITHDQSIVSYASLMRATPVEIDMHGEAYHYKTRTVRRNGKTKRERKRVTSHRATERMSYSRCEDASQAFDESDLALAKIVKCDFQIAWLPGDEHSS